jgi:hypothetical protein
LTNVAPDAPISRELLGLAVPDARCIQYPTMLQQQSGKGGIAAELLLKAHRIFAPQLTDLPPGMMIRFGEIGLTSVLWMWRGL